MMNQPHDKADDTTPAEIVPPVRQPTYFSGMSLRAKGVWVMVIFMAYTLSAGYIMGRERNFLYWNLEQL